MAEQAGENLPTVSLSDGRIDHSYNFLCLTLNSGIQIRLVAVAYIDSRLLVAVPQAVWRKRTASKRILPGLVRATLVEVGCSVKKEDGVEPADQNIKLWMGFLPAELEDLVSEDVDGVEFAHSFLGSDSEDSFPSAAGLVAAATDHFAFQSAIGGDDTPLEGPIVESGSHKRETRLGRLELLVGTLASKMDSALVAMQPAATSSAPTIAAPAAKRQSALRRKDADSHKDAPHVSFPSLDQSVVASALAAGVDEKSLREMQELMTDPQVKMKRMQEPAGSSAKAAPNVRRPNVVSALGETDSETEADNVVSAGSGEATPGGSSPSMGDAVSQLAQIVQVLTADRMKKQKVSRTESALDGVSASGVNEMGSIGSGKKTAAARRALRAALQENPEEIVSLIERLMMEDLGSQTVTPGQPLPHLCAKAWVEHRSRIGHWKSSAYTAWTTAAALDALRAGNVQGCRARLNLMLLMLDQTACDKGSWTLSSELSLEQPPPMSVLQTHAPPSVQDGELPFSRLLDPRWAEVAMSHIRDTEDYVSRRSKLGKKDGQPEGDPSPKIKPKPKAKGAAGSTVAGAET